MQSSIFERANRASEAPEFDINRREFPLIPERQLMLAILEDAISCYLAYLNPRSASQKLLFDDADHWFFEESVDWIFSFVNICRMSKLDPDYIRQGLLNARMNRQKSEDTHHLASPCKRVFPEPHYCPQCAAKKRLLSDFKYVPDAASHGDVLSRLTDTSVNL